MTNATDETTPTTSTERIIAGIRFDFPPDESAAGEDFPPIVLRRELSEILHGVDINAAWGKPKLAPLPQAGMLKPLTTVFFCCHEEASFRLCTQTKALL